MIYRLLIALPFIAAQGGVAPPNDRCVNAEPLVANEPTDGDTSFGNFDFNAQGVCGARSDRASLWYRITGTGREVTVQVCTNNGKITDYGVLTLCNSQNCQGFPAVNTGLIYDCAQNNTLDYRFIAEDQEWYYVHVRSDIGDINARNGSKFTVQYLEDEDDEPVATQGDSAMGLSAMFALGVSSVLALV
ncbi:unnamed protein product [Cylindrotheca closterium]|uniref:Uncharacterized protein n=1 Tax=Cylindrotheca closterium TaxID=2856 RepID=A0AAD2G4E0_9STRA|nr:unnamed protein product [Cylindrotheca closterium]